MKIIIMSLLILSLIHLVCEKGLLKQSAGTITLTPEYIQAKDAWLYIAVQSGYTGTDVLIYQDGNRIDRFKMTKQDTLYRVSNLAVQTEYLFKAILNISDKLEFASPEIKIVTLDTTTGITEWEEYVLGDFGAGMFRDIEAISDEEVWAVGSVNYSNSKRNGAKWNGSGWNLLEIPVLIYGSWEKDSAYGSSSLMAALAVNKNDIWFTSGGVFFNYNGTKWGNYTFLFQSLSDPDFGLVRDASLLAPNNIWAAGDKGAVYHYDGTTWQQKASPTKEKLNTITGYATDDGYQVWIGGKNILYYKNENDEWQTIMDGNPTDFGFSAAEVRVLRQYDESNLYIAIWGEQNSGGHKGYIYRMNPDHPDRKILLGVTDHFYTDMVVYKPNEIYLGGTWGNSITQYDGCKVFLYPALNQADWFLGVSASENYVYLSGERNQRGLILRGHK